jgi:hypothetical protein
MMQDVFIGFLRITIVGIVTPEYTKGRVLRMYHELEVRGDIYTYDALSWALYRNKQYVEADAALKRALRFGTPEPTFYYHTGLIDSALGKKDEGCRRAGVCRGV